jgi:hypothetical protein
MKGTIFWVLTSLDEDKVYSFGDTYHLHLQGQTESQARPDSPGFLLYLFLNPENGSDMLLRNIGLPPPQLHRVKTRMNRLVTSIFSTQPRNLPYISRSTSTSGTDNADTHSIVILYF